MDVASSTRSFTVVGVLALALGCSGARAPETAAPDGEPSAPAARVASEGPVAVAARPAPPAPAIRELAPEEALLESRIDQEGVAPEEAPEASAVLAESLEAFESSQAFWEQGAFDDAFAALDRAYELMASVPMNGDPMIAQEKENLRHLISRRVVEIYASRQSAVGDPNGSIRLTLNEDVEREIALFQGPERSFFLESYRRSGLYRPMILQRLRAAGLPEQLSWLPLVESGFKSRALSHAQALGLWQFISSTGYRYGLERSDWVDERMDPEKATDGAIGYLTDLHGLFGDWMTALAAYNCGERAVLRQIQNQPVSYFDRFWDLYQRLPRETRRYVPRFLAVLAILDDPAGYGFELPEPMAPIEYETVEVTRAAELSALDRALGQAEGTLALLNPELRLGATPDAAYALKVPRGTGARVAAQVASLPAWKPPQPQVSVHRVRRGDTLSGIASRYGTSVSAIMQANRLRSAHHIHPGQQLQVPGRGRSGGGGSSSVYVVRRGDTLGAIARRQGVALARLLAANDLSSRSTIYPGQRLTIPR
ncbi:MAG TPA: LysM peptidoglycan-binding domain-containing protein [Thermoanaerobaculia bacterium]|nr:LysM peptidoglycan-binding domain-containing protein [Thermoanaerobaculia bacterium]